MANEIKTAFDTAFRDYVTDGVPSSGVNHPQKADIRSAGFVVQTQLDAEASARAAADDLLQTNIVAEAAARAGADTTLQTAIDAATASFLTGQKPLISSVRVLTTTDVATATALENGDTLDGVTLVTGDRVAKAYNGTTGAASNGIWIVQASGAALRATDADSDTELRNGAFYVDAGSYAGQLWAVKNTSAITVDTTPIVIEKARNAVDTTAATVTIGRAVTPVTGTALSTANRLYVTPAAVDMTLKTIRVYAMADGDLRIAAWIKNGTNYRRADNKALIIPVKSGLQTITSSQFGLFRLLSGQLIGFESASNTAGTGVVPQITATADSGGYVSSDTNSWETDFTWAIAATTNLQPQIGFDFVVGDAAAADAKELEASYDETVVNATFTNDGLSITTTVDLKRQAGTLRLTDTRTLTGPTTDYERFDVLYVNSETLAIGVTAGTERTTDSTHFIPAMSDPAHIPVFNLRLDGTAADGITVLGVPVWQTFDGEMRTLSEVMERDRRRNRMLLPKTRAKIARGDALHFGGFGDSITAIQKAGTTSLTSTPNGNLRDRGASPLSDANHYLRDGYGDDVVGVLETDATSDVPRYTAAQLGRTPDAEGTVYTRVGWNWELVTALEARGYVLGTDLTYDNFGIGGWSSANAVVAGVPQTWLNSAVGLGWDFAVIGLGMNELGSSDTIDRIGVIITEFQDAGTECIVLGVPRPRSPLRSNIRNWQLTNRALRLAAEANNAAFISMNPLYQENNLAALGITTFDTSEANNFNHPGLLEFKAIGKQIIKTLLG